MRGMKMKIEELAAKNKSDLINAIKQEKNPSWRGPGKSHSIPEGLRIFDRTYDDEGKELGWATESYSWNDLRRMSAAEVAVIAWRCKVTEKTFETLYPLPIEEIQEAVKKAKVAIGCKLDPTNKRVDAPRRYAGEEE